MTRRRDLDDEISLREASLRDARREYEAGDLTSDELAEIEARDLAAQSRTPIPAVDGVTVMLEPYCACSADKMSPSLRPLLTMRSI